MLKDNIRSESGCTTPFFPNCWCNIWHKSAFISSEKRHLRLDSEQREAGGTWSTHPQTLTLKAKRDLTYMVYGYAMLCFLDFENISNFDHVYTQNALFWYENKMTEKLQPVFFLPVYLCNLQLKLISIHPHFFHIYPQHLVLLLQYLDLCSSFDKFIIINVSATFILDIFATSSFT